jgi:hypothetical protein
MALWGNNDAKGSGGTVSLDYATLVVTGSGTTFGQVGAAAIGDIIRFGTRPNSYFGDAIIVGIASTTQLSIASTSALSGASISGVQFDISELPKYTTWDSVYTQKTQSAAETTLVVRTSAAATSGIGSDKVTLVSVSGIQTGDTLASGTVSRSVASVTGSIVSLASTINVAIASGAQVTVTRLTGEQNSSVYGVAGAGLDSAQTTSYALTHAGWVGMTTYIDASGSLRVKTETLVAMSGIQTGNTPLYDSNPLAWYYMLFTELNEENFLLFAIKNYENPQAVTKEDFDRDLNHFKYIKRLFRRYKNTGVLKTHLLINHFVILYNIFGEATTPMLFFKIDNDLWPYMKTFVVFLNKLPEYPRGYIHDIPIDIFCAQELEKITNE